MFLIWSQEKVNNKFYQEIYNANVNINLMEENVIQIKSGITINVELNVKSRIYEKKIMFGIVLHIVVKMDNI